MIGRLAQSSSRRSTLAFLSPRSASCPSSCGHFIQSSSCQLSSQAAGKTKSRTKRPFRNTVGSFLKKVQSRSVPSALVCQRVEELLLKLVTKDNIPSDGPLSLNLLNAALRNANVPNERLIPRLVSLSCQVMIQSGHPLALKEVHRQLWNLLENHKIYLTNDIQYNSHHVNDACAQFIKHSVLESNQKKRRLSYKESQQTKAMMDQLQRLYSEESVPLLASSISINSFIMLHCNQQKPRLAYDLLKWMVDESAAHPVELVPRLESFTATISAFSKAREPEVSLEIIQWMLEQSRRENTVMPPPNSGCFNAMIDAWAKSGDENASLKAEQTLEWMQQLRDTEQLDTAPDEVSFACCIDAWARSKDTKAPLRAEALLRRMIADFEGGSQIGPTNIAFTSVMNAWANSTAQDAPARVSALLDLMHTMSKSSTQLQVTSVQYTVLVKAWEQASRQSRGRKKLECANEAYSVIRRMSDEQVTCTPPVYNAVIMAILEISPVMAVLLFLELEELFRRGEIGLDTRSFNCGLSALATLNKPDADSRSMEVLQRMFEYSQKDGSVHPDGTTFNLILKVLSRSNRTDAAQRAQDLLIDMEKMPSVRPSAISYLTCIMGWGRSEDNEKYRHVRDMLVRYGKNSRKGGETNRRGNPAVYNAALSVCRHNTSPQLAEEALETALFAMKLLRKHGDLRADETTYEHFFHAVRVVAEGRTAQERCTLVESELGNCVDDGLARKPILQTAWDVSPEAFKKKFGENEQPGTVIVPTKRRSGSRHQKRGPRRSSQAN